MSSRPAHSLRSYRKRSGLSQQEASFLLGAIYNAKVSRYETGHRVPPLRTALAYAAILGVPLPELFPHVQREVTKEVTGRILGLQAKLAEAPKQKRGSRRATRMHKWLQRRHAELTTMH